MRDDVKDGGGVKTLLHAPALYLMIRVHYVLVDGMEHTSYLHCCREVEDMQPLVQGETDGDKEHTLILGIHPLGSKLNLFFSI